MKPQDFVRAYEQALASQDWRQVEPLLHPNVCVTFSNGKRHQGIANVEKAYRANFAAIQDEQYAVSEVHWVHPDAAFAVYLFQFRWSGRINGQVAAGGGLGTSVLEHSEGRWRLLTEHLGPG